VWAVLWIGLRASGVVGVAARLRVAVDSTGRWNRNLFATVAVYGLGCAPLAFGLYAAPLYLSRVLHVGQASLGHLLWIPPAGWECGYLFWGRVADRRTARGLGRPAGLFAAFAVAGFVVVLAPLAVGLAHPVAATMGIFFVEMFIAGGFVVMSLSDGMSVQRKEHAGFLAGFAISSWALVTGILTPYLGHLFDRREYAAGFWLIAALPVVGVVVWAGLRERVSPSVLLR
jgi:ACS family hexuronate transporter-like MFS transporter